MNFDQYYPMTINGKAVGGSATFGVVNPATERVFAQVPDATRDELDAAVRAARDAFPAWAATPIAERRRLLDALGDAILANLDPLKRLLTMERPTISR